MWFYTVLVVYGGQVCIMLIKNTYKKNKKKTFMIKKGISGLGYFADKDIRAGERIMLGLTYNIHVYYGLKQHGDTKYVNHGYNAKFVDIDREAWIEATQDIKMGEEVLVDYLSIDYTFVGQAFYIRFRRSLGDTNMLFERYPRMFRLQEWIARLIRNDKPRD